MTRHRLGIAGATLEEQSGAGVSSNTELIMGTVDDLVALHSSDPVTVYLSLLTRLPTVTIQDIRDCLYESRELLRVHGMRRTLWVGPTQTATDIVAASAARLLKADRRRLAKLLEDGTAVGDGLAWIEAASAEIEAFVAEAGTCTTREVGEALPHLALGIEGAPGKSYSATISAHSRVLLLLGFGGRIIRTDPIGTWIASQYRWATPQVWTGTSSVTVKPDSAGHPAREADAQAKVISRYIDRFGPVTIDDVVWWTGWPKGMVSKAISALGADIAEVQLSDTGQTALMTPSAADQITRTPPNVDHTRVAILPSLDPTIMGWKQRDWYLEDAVKTRIFDRNGNGGPAIMVNGRLVGGWAQRSSGELVYELLDDVGVEATSSVEAQLDHLDRRLRGSGYGEPNFNVRFPSPMNKELAR